jgi:hypothetical protein
MASTRNMDFWYDRQLRRYLLQLVRVFSNFRVEEITSTGTVLNRVPARLADSSRLVANLIRKNSENVLNSAPFIAVNLSGIAISRGRAQDPFNIDTRQITERKFDEVAGTYTTEPGNLYTVQRFMPVPYDLTITVDIWTTNLDTKAQLMEQILVLFNPSIQLQSNDNPLDWANVFEVTLTNINWSSRSVPQGADDQLDIATLTFEVPIWISPPAKVKRQKIIQQIIADIKTVDNVKNLGYDPGYADFFAGLESQAQIVITPGDFELLVQGNNLTLLNNMNQPQSWSKLLEQYGDLSEVSTIKLITDGDIEEGEFIVGFISTTASDSVLAWEVDIDSLPSDTLSSVLRIINPQEKYPGNGLDAASEGQRYLLAEDLTALDNWQWSGFPVPLAGSILEYIGGSWQVAFDSRVETSIAFVTNSFTGKQYRWTEQGWIHSWEGRYRPGYWRISL